MTTEYPFRPVMQKVFWKDVSKDVNKIAPDFAKLVDEINPGLDFPLYQVSYPFGSMIVKKGVCYYPNNHGKLVPLEDSSLTPEVKKDFAYTNAKFPAGLILQNSTELYVPTSNSLHPQDFFTPGHIFALWYYLGKNQTFHPNKIFDVTSGARSIFLLPNIGDANNHTALRREFKIKSSPPKDLISEWELFVALTNNPETKCDWHSSLLFLPGKWIEKIISRDKKWIFLSQYLYERSWSNTDFFRNKIYYDFAFSRVQAARNLRPNPYIADTVKHIVTIATGTMPGFAPALNNLGAPIDLLQKIFLDIYKIKKYAPTFIQPEYFPLEKAKRPVYYSMTLPTTLEFSPNCRKVRTTLSDLRELAYILSVYLEEISKEYLEMNNTPLETIVKKVDFSYYHDEFDREECVLHTRELLKSDPTLVQCPVGYNNKTFAQSAAFLRGCVKISLKNKTEKK